MQLLTAANAPFINGGTADAALPGGGKSSRLAGREASSSAPSPTVRLHAHFGSETSLIPCGKLLEAGGGRQGGGEERGRMPGYRIGGKTGTAQVYKDGRIARDVHIGSLLWLCAGGGPAASPVLVVVEEAQVPRWTTAAPRRRPLRGKSSRLCPDVI